MQSLPLGTAYTVWTGIGAIGAFIVGIVFLGEPANALRLAAAAMILGRAGADEAQQPRLAANVFRDLDQIAVGIAKIHRPDRTHRPVALDRT